MKTRVCTLYCCNFLVTKSNNIPVGWPSTVDPSSSHFDYLYAIGFSLNPEYNLWYMLTFTGNTVLRNFFPVVRTNPHELVPVPARKQSKCKYCQYLVLVLKTRKEAPVPKKQPWLQYNTFNAYIIAKLILMSYSIRSNIVIVIDNK